MRFLGEEGRGDLWDTPGPCEPSLPNILRKTPIWFERNAEPDDRG